jgi:hypothetical protein
MSAEEKENGSAKPLTRREEAARWTRDDGTRVAESTTEGEEKRERDDADGVPVAKRL